MISAYCQSIFDQTPFLRTLGARLRKAHTGECEIFAHAQGKEPTLTAKMTTTIAILSA